MMLALIAGPVPARAETTRYVVDEYVPSEQVPSATMDIECGDYTGTYDFSYHFTGFIDTVTKPNGEQIFFIHTQLSDAQLVNTETGTTFDLHGVNNEIHADGTQASQSSGSQLLVSHDTKLRLSTSYTVRLDENGEPVFENIQTHSNCPA